ncbi:MAG: hypothetical protein JW867_07910 [Candidatus Omnitrophica bacterium]|nr:hypothetical protein [Candidatus Omnitrophota bacterium]
MKRFDFALNWSGNIKESFVKFLEKACKKRKLSFLWINDDNVRSVLRNLQTAKLTTHVLLDTEATYNKKSDVYAKVCYAVKDCSGAVINDPDRAKVAIDKAITHYELLNLGILTPFTVVVRNWEPKTFVLSQEERQRLGVPFIIKPALGYGQLGVIRDAKGSVEEIAQARSYDKGDNFLFQEKIMPLTLGGKRAWFRVFNLFNTIIPCWWDDQENNYEHVNYEEFNTFGFFPLVKYVAKIANLTKMAWFSTEIAIDMKNQKKRFLAIDYVNDQCSMDTKTDTPSGVPDNVVKFTADRMADVAFRYIHGQRLSKKYIIWLKDATIEIRGLGPAPDLLKSSSSPKLNSKNKFSHRILDILR